MSRADRSHRRCARVVTTAVLALLAVGCTNDDEPAVLPTPSSDTSTSSKSSPTSDAPPALTQADAEAAAEAAVHDYLALFDEISADPDRDLVELERVAADRALQWSAHLLTTWRDANERRVGAQVASDFTVTTVVLDPDEATGTDNPRVDLTACLDVSATDILDEDGNSVVHPDRLDRVLVDYVVANPSWPDDQHWLVIRDDPQLTDSTPPEFVSCD